MLNVVFTDNTRSIIYQTPPTNEQTYVEGSYTGNIAFALCDGYTSWTKTTTSGVVISYRHDYTSQLGQLSVSYNGFTQTLNLNHSSHTIIYKLVFSGNVQYEQNPDIYIRAIPDTYGSVTSGGIEYYKWFGTGGVSKNGKLLTDWLLENANRTILGWIDFNNDLTGTIYWKNNQFPNGADWLFLYVNNMNPSVNSLSIRRDTSSVLIGGAVPDGYPITYSMSGCTGDPDNPTTIPVGGSITATFTPNEGKAFDDTSVTVASAGTVDYTWVPSTGTLTITSTTAAVSVTVRGYDGYAVTYSMSGCTGSTSNPSIIQPNAAVTTMNFTANSGRAFDAESVHISGTGYPSGDVQFNWNPETGVLRVGPVASAISVSVIARVVDPYAPGGHTEPQDGNGSFDYTGDNVEMSTLPTVSFTSTGFVRIYNPSLQQLSNLASYMWTDSTFLQTVVNHAKQLLENPIESIISLNLLPCPIPNGNAEEVKVLFIPTGVYMPPATTQFVEVDCGSVQLTEVYGSALDYSPYTKVHCYLPYIGTVTLDTDEVMGKTISIKYRVDVATGVCVAHIMVNGDVFYQFSGHCAVAMPLTSADFSAYIAAAIGTAKAVAGVAAAGAGAPGVAAALTGTPAPRSTSSKTTETARNPSTGRQITTGTKSHQSESQGATFGEIAAKAASNTVGAVMGSKMVVEHSGGFTGNSGYMGVRRPYLVVEIPRIANPENYAKYNGFPSMITARLGDCTGYTEVQSVQLTGFKATNPELTQIGELLKAGVIL